PDIARRFDAVSSVRRIPGGRRTGTRCRGARSVPENHRRPRTRDRREGGLMPPYPKANWVCASWWAATPAQRSTTRRRIAVLWSKAAAAPKPRHKEFVDELKGWSGRLADG